MSSQASLAFDWSTVDADADERIAGVARSDWDPLTGGGLWRASYWAAEDLTLVPEETPLYMGPGDLLISVTGDVAPVIRALAARWLAEPLAGMVEVGHGMLLGVMSLDDVPRWFGDLWAAAATEWLYEYASAAPREAPGPTEWSKSLQHLMHARPEGGALNMVVTAAHMRWMDPAYDPTERMGVTETIYDVDLPYLQRALRDLESWKGNSAAAQQLLSAPYPVRSLTRHWLEAAERGKARPLPRMSRGYGTRHYAAPPATDGTYHWDGGSGDVSEPEKPAVEVVLRGPLERRYTGKGRE